MSKWHIRTVKNGTVKILGNLYRAYDPHREYKGELDGCKYMFAGPREDYVTKRLAVSMWGSKEMAEAGRYAPTEEALNEAMNAVAHTEKHIIDGYIYWNCWRQV